MSSSLRSDNATLASSRATSARITSPAGSCAAPGSEITLQTDSLFRSIPSASSETSRGATIRMWTIRRSVSAGSTYRAGCAHDRRGDDDAPLDDPDGRDDRPARTRAPARVMARLASPPASERGRIVRTDERLDRRHLPRIHARRHEAWRQCAQIVETGHSLLPLQRERPQRRRVASALHGGCCIKPFLALCSRLMDALRRCLNGPSRPCGSSTTLGATCAPADRRSSASNRATCVGLSCLTVSYVRAMTCEVGEARSRSPWPALPAAARRASPARRCPDRGDVLDRRWKPPETHAA